MKLPNRLLCATLAMVALIYFLLNTVRGPVLTAGVAFYAPIMIGAFLAWRFLAYRKNRARSFTFLVGVAGGLVGTLVWPTGILVWQMLTGTTDPQILPIVMFFACCFVASALGGAVAMILSLGFDWQPERNLPAAKSTDLAIDQIPIQNAV